MGHLLARGQPLNDLLAQGVLRRDHGSVGDHLQHKPEEALRERRRLLRIIRTLGRGRRLTHAATQFEEVEQTEALDEGRHKVLGAQQHHGALHGLRRGRTRVAGEKRERQPFYSVHRRRHELHRVPANRLGSLGQTGSCCGTNEIA
jgi:hypothetical protein